MNAVAGRHDCAFRGPDPVGGVDEAGRGPLAGPVVAAAVILDPRRPIRGLADSKVLAPDVRERARSERSASRALAWSIAWADREEIDALNILQATLLAMRRALLGLAHCAAMRSRSTAIAARRSTGLTLRCPACCRSSRAMRWCPRSARRRSSPRPSATRGCASLHELYPHYGFACTQGLRDAAASRCARAARRMPSAPSLVHRQCTCSSWMALRSTAKSATQSPCEPATSAAVDVPDPRA